MTYGVKTIMGVLRPTEKIEGFFGTAKPLFGANWKSMVGPKQLWCPMTRMPFSLDDAWTYLIGCHCGHLLEFIVALLSWCIMFPADWTTVCKEWLIDWLSRVVAFNLVCEVVF